MGINPVPKKLSQPSPNPVGLRSEHVIPWAVYSFVSLLALPLLFPIPLTVGRVPLWFLVCPVGPGVSYVFLKIAGVLLPRGLLVAWWDNLFLPVVFEPENESPNDLPYLTDDRPRSW